MTYIFKNKFFSVFSKYIKVYSFFDLIKCRIYTDLFVVIVEQWYLYACIVHRRRHHDLCLVPKLLSRFTSKTLWHQRKIYIHGLKKLFFDISITIIIIITANYYTKDVNG